VLAVSLASLVFGVSQLHDYGVTSDAPALFYAGDRTLFYLGHRDVPDALNFDGPEPAGLTSGFDREQAAHNDPIWCPVFPSLVAAVTSRLFHDRLGWLNELDGHHLGLVLIHVVGLFLFGRYACRLLGPAAGVAATIALALFPSALGNSFNNPKDWPCALFYAVAVLAAGVGLTEGRPRSLVAFGVYAGIALSGKANGAFALVTVALWAPVAYLLVYRPQRRAFAPHLALLVAAPYLAVATFVLLWPWLWYPEQPQTSWSHLAEYVRFVLERGYGARKTWVAYPFTCVAITTPPIVLAAAAAGLATGWRGDRCRRAIWWLLVIWLLLPLLRIAKPRSNFYDGNRHFLEYVPAICCLAGIGFVAAIRGVRRLGGALAARRGWGGARARVVSLAPAVLGALALVSDVAPVAVSHPFETTYFNIFIGGLQGAQRRHPLKPPPPHDAWAVDSECDYWWSSLRRAIAGIRDHGDARSIGVCGNTARLGRMNWASSAPTPEFIGGIDGYGGTGDLARAEYVYAMPRDFFCSTETIRGLEARRPVLHRETRQGGLIYELLGPPR
jgi:hypothetical protein